MRTRKAVVILISGLAESGKTTAKDYLVSKLKQIDGIDAAAYSFANPLKYMAQAYIGWNKEKDDAGRKLLQDIGKVGREYDHDIWVKHLLKQMDDSNKRSGGLFPVNFWVIDDWRFPNEKEFLDKNPLLDVVTIRLFGRGGLSGDVANDVSETSLPEISAELIPTSLEGDHWYDFQVDNSEDLELLKYKLDMVLAEISKKYII